MTTVARQLRMTFVEVRATSINRRYPGWPRSATRAGRTTRRAEQDHELFTDLRRLAGWGLARHRTPSVSWAARAQDGGPPDAPGDARRTERGRYPAREARQRPAWRAGHLSEDAAGLPPRPPLNSSPYTCGPAPPPSRPGPPPHPPPPPPTP